MPLSVSHLSRDLSSVAEPMALVTTSSYLSFESVSIFSSGGKGFLSNEREVRRIVIVCSERKDLQTGSSFTIEKCFEIFGIHSVAIDRPTKHTRDIRHEKRQRLV